MYTCPQYDVIVIGAGPAAIAAAIRSYQKGLSVIIIVKSDENIEAMPAETIHPGINAILASLQIDHKLSAASVGTYKGIKIGNMIADLGGDSDNTPWFGHHINRKVFDKMLFDSAIKKKIHILTNETVSGLILDDDCVTGIITQSNKKISSKYVIDGSGVMRFAGKQLKFSEHFFSPPLVCWSGISTHIESHHHLYDDNYSTFAPAKNGWYWIAPTPPTTCTWTMLSKRGKQSFLPPDILKNYPLIGEVKKRNVRWRLFRPLCKQGIVLCGDAAGILDPAAGQGILNALCSGIEAANTVAACLENPDNESVFLAQYDNWYYEMYSEKAKQLKMHYLQHKIDIF